MNKKWLLINVLNKRSYTDCHIPGSINIPLDELASTAKNIDKNQEIIVYCAQYSCPLSRKAWHLLNDMGFTNVRAYEGGAREWKEKEWPLEGACQADYFSSSAPALAPDAKVKTISAQELRNKLEF